VSFIELHPWRRKMNFGVEVVKPRFRIDGGADGVLPTWTPHRVPVEPGPHRVEMWIVWGLYKQAGLNAVDLDVPPQGVRVSWRSPSAAFAKGQFTIEAPGTEPYNMAPLPTGQPEQAAGFANPAAWHPDPSGRHQYRWWDGSAWTQSVSDNGVVTQDSQ
jgi:Protein of unknown function (DUF2510)